MEGSYEDEYNNNNNEDTNMIPVFEIPTDSQNYPSTSSNLHFPKMGTIPKSQTKMDMDDPAERDLLELLSLLDSFEPIVKTFFERNSQRKIIKNKSNIS
jgi:hypothetical protein